MIRSYCDSENVKTRTFRRVFFQMSTSSEDSSAGLKAAARGLVTICWFDGRCAFVEQEIHIWHKSDWQAISRENVLSVSPLKLKDTAFKQPLSVAFQPMDRLKVPRSPDTHFKYLSNEALAIRFAIDLHDEFCGWWIDAEGPIPICESGNHEA